MHAFAYAKPASLADAVRAAGDPGAKLLAGGQSLLAVMKLGLAAPRSLVDLAGLAELRGIAVSGGVVRIGAMSTHAAVAGSTEVAAAIPALAALARGIGDRQVRNRGTIGGNVCVNDPTNHYPPLLTALGASFTIRGASAERTVPADEFFLGVYLTAVEEGELLTKISVPTRGPGTGDAMAGITVGAHGTYLVNAAATVGPAGTRIVIGCVSSVPVRATAMEEHLGAGGLSEASVRAAATGLGATLDPPSDVHATADYRRHLAEVSAVRAVLQAAARAKG